MATRYSFKKLRGDERIGVDNQILRWRKSNRNKMANTNNPSIGQTEKYDRKTRRQIHQYVRNEWQHVGAKYPKRIEFVEYMVGKLRSLGCKAPDGREMTNNCVAYQVRQAIGPVYIKKPEKKPISPESPRATFATEVKKSVAPTKVQGTLKAIMADDALDAEAKAALITAYFRLVG